MDARLTLTVYFGRYSMGYGLRPVAKIDRSMPIVIETEEFPKFPFEIKSANF